MVAKTILVTGSNGFIGSVLVSYLLAESESKVVGLSKGNCRRSKHSNFFYENVDITSSQKIVDVINLYQPDVIVHCAAISQVDVCENDPQLCERVNVIATKVLLEESIKLKAHFIFLSSDFVFDGTSNWVTETTRLNPISVYGKTKWDAEKIIESSTSNWSIIRPVLVYGFSKIASRGNIFSWVLASLRNNKHINVAEDQFRTPTLVMDVVQLISSIIQSGVKGYYNIGGRERVSVHDFALKIAAISKLSAEFIHPVKSKNLNGGELRPKISCFNSQKIEEEFELYPVNLNVGIETALRQINSSIW